MTAHNDSRRTARLKLLYLIPLTLLAFVPYLLACAWGLLSELADGVRNAWNHE
ncbi:hypothetical protein DES46_102349 [Caldimonas thermodepolymerans]|nr:hypothetical protein DES46_102349 [Caldimonas thermodepolymerans]